ncbi:hypothetical protein EV213_11480 [Aureibacillus halotolerans]|uniref:Uncharacterized protein n=1 Tax=Aureibacillus halotolerans TaxID=1508390 RepID=A0A4R6TUW9_9BACI|nr:hypothetical protein EV213_11480 [Aureibacillus halotolerans]
MSPFTLFANLFSLCRLILPDPLELNEVVPSSLSLSRRLWYAQLVLTMS